MTRKADPAGKTRLGRTVLSRSWERRYAILYLMLGAWLLVGVSRFHDARTGFTSLERFGDRLEARRLPQLRDVPIYTFRESDGYDGQFYAQIAVAGDPFDPDLAAALDAPLYRNLRILLPMLAHGVGLGRPFWVLNAYALLGVAAWLALALLLARTWFPPTDLHNFLRWAGTLFGAGMMMSVTLALSDGPALLFLALGMLFVERKRPWLGAAWLGAAGLVRETSVLFSAALAPLGERGRKPWLRGALASVACLLPVLVWAWILTRRYGFYSGPGALGLPFAGLMRKIGEIHGLWETMGYNAVRRSIGGIVAISAQVIFIVARPRLADPWWRIGAVFAALCVLLSWPVWQGWPGAAFRALLPLTLAFNVLCPRTRRGLALLLAGNLSVLSAGYFLRPPPRERTAVADGIRHEYFRRDDSAGLPYPMTKATEHVQEKR